MNKKILYVPLAAILSITLNAAKADEVYGVEANIVPFFLDGYHASAWYGKNGYRIRAVIAEATLPSSFTESGFRDQRQRYYEAEFDVFFGNEKTKFRGPWVAAGVGRTEHEIFSSSTNDSASLFTTDIHFGTGYTAEISHKFTVNPWIGGAIHTDMPNNVAVGSEVWHPEKIGIVGGVKFGYEF